MLYYFIELKLNFEMDFNICHLLIRPGFNNLNED